MHAADDNYGGVESNQARLRGQEGEHQKAPRGREECKNGQENSSRLVHWVAGLRVGIPRLQDANVEAEGGHEGQENLESSTKVEDAKGCDSENAQFLETGQVCQEIAEP